MKVLQIAHASHSYFTEDGKKDIKEITLNDWYSKTAVHLKKYYPNIKVECLAPEKKWKNKRKFIHKEIPFKFFPTNCSPIYALDFSISLLKYINKEVKLAKKRKEKIILHLHEYHNLHGLLIATLFPKQKIIGQHHGGSWPLKHLRETKKYRYFFPLFWLGQLWENLVLKNINTFYALSKDELLYLKKVAPRSKVRFQTMGIDEVCYKTASKEKARKELNLKQNDKILVFLGRVNTTKGIPYILKAAKALKEIKFIIIGFGEVEKYKSITKKMKLKNVIFTGGIYGDKRFLYLSAMDAFILPSSKEGAPVTVMESMARDRPCIVSNVGGVGLMIENGKNGIIIRPRNAKDIVYATNTIFKKPIKNSKKYANAYKWEKIINDTIKDYGTPLNRA